MPKELPIAIETFPDLIRTGCYYVDKTSFIKTVMTTGQKVLLVARPRRFGKTLFLDMLKSFLQLEWQNPRGTTGHAKLFAGLQILADADFCRRYMGQFPVVSLTLKDIEGESYAGAYALFASLLESKAATYHLLLESPRLTAADKNTLRKYLTPDYLKDRAHEADAKSFLKDLVICLSKHFQSRVVLLIDEYDTPLVKAAQFGYCKDMQKLLGSLLGQVLKDPDVSAFVEKAVLAGCLRIGTSVFTGITLDVNTVCSDDPSLSHLIGFSTEEVKSLLDACGLADRFADAKHWYDGYRFAGQTIYCPWDVINFADKALASEWPHEYLPESYWEATSSNDVLEAFLRVLTTEDADKMQRLVDGGATEITINDKLDPSNFPYNNSSAFWTMLLFTGYLTTTARNDALSTHEVKIPNEEIRHTFKEKIRTHYSNRQYAQHGGNLASAFLAGDADAVYKTLQPLLSQHVSIRKAATTTTSERCCYDFLSTILICAGDKAANRHSISEVGTSFSNLAFTSEGLDTGVVIAIKRCSTPEDMPSAAEFAIKELKDHRCVRTFNGYQCDRIHGFGIAFCKRRCFVKVEALTS